LRKRRQPVTAFPSTLGACIDLLYKMREDRHAIEKKAEAIKIKEDELETHLLETFKKTDLEGAQGKRATAGVSMSTVPSVKDWDKVFAYIKKKGAFDLLQKRLSATAYRERLESKVAVPGVEPFNVVKLSLRKR
jgi:hypothetical protein